MAKHNTSTYSKKQITLMGERIRALRHEAGFESYEAFAFKHKLPRVQYWRMEKGTNFTIKSLLPLLNIHKISLAEFFKNME